MKASLLISYFVQIQCTFEFRIFSKVLQKAAANNKRIKIVGFGHSPSDICLTSDYMMSLLKFNRVLQVRVCNLFLHPHSKAVESQ